jgi:lipopolysaccharide heptosyltransferase I
MVNRAGNTPTADPRDFNRLAIIRLSSLGDIIHTLPAFQTMRNRFPKAEITWVVEPLGGELLKNFPGIDQVLVVNPKVKGLLNKIREMGRIRAAGNGRHDMILDFQGLLKSALISSRLTGRRAGFHRSNLREPAAHLFYQVHAAPFDDRRHVVKKNLHLLSVLGIEEDRVEYPTPELSPSDTLNRWLRSSDTGDRGYVVLNVGGGWDTKILSVDQYVDIVKGLKSLYPVYLLWGNAREEKIAAAVGKKTGLPESPFFEFSDLILFLSGAALVITSDTLALHIADMVRTPSVGIFGPTSPERNGSLLEDSIAVRSTVSCRFCYKKKCDTMDCLGDISPGDVVSAAKTIYEKFR